MLITPQDATLVADLLCVALCAACAWRDARSYRIPNTLTFGGAMAGGLLALSTGAWPMVNTSLLGLAVGLLALLPATALRAVGMGDVKLLAAVGALVRFPLVLSAVVNTLLWGGILALAHAARRGVLGASLRNVLAMPARGPAALTLHRMPYGLAIFAGTVHAVASRYWPGLALW
jgi:prepilin peptidase CpaA